MKNSTKQDFDKALESLEDGACLCWECAEKHYPEEFKLRNNFFVYRRYCDACGHKKDDCTWTSLWRGVIFTTKPLDYLIKRFEEDSEHHGSLLRIKGSDAGWEIIKRGKEALEKVFVYLKDNSNVSSNAWLYFCDRYARHHILVDNSFVFPQTISAWKEILQAA